MRRKVTKDLNKAKALRKMAEVRLERLGLMDAKRYPSNTLEDYYGIIHNLIEALSSIEGIKLSGDNAHKEIIDWASSEMGYSESKRVFLQNLRSYRNRIAYEGFFINSGFIEQNESEMKGIIKDIDEEVRKRS